MSKQFIVASGSGRLVFSLPFGADKLGDYLMVTFSDEGLSASTRVYDAAGQMLEVPRLFQDLARNWQGWSGTKSWRSIEGDLCLHCTSDGKGHVQIGVEISHGFGLPDAWTAKGQLVIEAGSLQGIADHAIRFFG